MDIIHFATELPADTVHVTVEVPQAEHAKVLCATTSRSDLLGSGDDWSQIRDFVVRKIETRWGVFPRNPITETSIFRSFSQRWGTEASEIARVACDDMGCVWRGAPLSVSRFAKGSDPYFAQIIASRLATT